MLSQLVRRTSHLRPSPVWCGLLALLVVGALILLAPEMVFARAGGGGGFGGGGGGGGGGFGGGGGGGFGGGGGGFSGGGGSGDPRAFFVMLAIFIVVAIIQAALQAHQRRISNTIRRAYARQVDELRQQMLDRIKEGDPAFDLERVSQRISSAFVQIQQAWTQQNMQPVRAFISDGILERFSMQLAMQKAQGLRNVMQNVRVHNAQLAAAIATEQFDTLHFEIHASATDYQVRVESGREVAGTRRADEFVEFWSFHRRHGAQTQSRGGSIEGQCPQCASPLSIVDKAQCTACGAWVNSAEHDWVLAEITQQSEWTLPGDDATTPGVTALRHNDPAFSIQHIEDRASVMFWRLRAAEFYGEIGHAAPVLGQTAGDLRRLLKEAIKQQVYFHEPAVGLVDLIDVLPRGDGSRDVARVKIRWSGTKAAGSPAGRHRTLHRKAIYTEVLLLEREAGVQSSPQQTFASSSCPGCGASLGVNREPDCSFCGTPLTDGRHDWVLVDVRPFTAEINRFSKSLQHRYETSRPRDVLGAAGHTPHADRGLDLAVIARVLAMDGELTRREIAAFRKLAKREGVAEAEAELMLTNADYLDTPLPIPENGQEARRQLEQVALATLIDGRLTRNEQRLLKRYAQHFDLSAADVKLVIRETRARLYRQARDSRNGDSRA
jgi:hypothetical protein